MNTPIFDFVSEYAEKNYVRAHMPGHKGASDGNAISAVYPYDITEIGGADSLFEADGIIAESEMRLSFFIRTEHSIPQAVPHFAYSLCSLWSAKAATPSLPQEIHTRHSSIPVSCSDLTLNGSIPNLRTARSLQEK